MLNVQNILWIVLCRRSAGEEFKLREDSYFYQGDMRPWFILQYVFFLILTFIHFYHIMLTLTTMYIFFLHSSIVIKAQGEARAAELVGKAIQKNPAFIQLRRIEAAKDVASTVANSQNKIYLNSDNLLLNHLGEAPSLSTGGTEKKGW